MIVDTNAETVAKLNAIIHDLARACANLNIGNKQTARDLMKAANMDLTVLRVAFDRDIGPKEARLPDPPRRKARR